MRKLIVTDPAGGRRRIAAYLAAHGPTHGDRLAERLGLSLDRFWALVNCPWFTIVVGGWGLTDRGRREALDDPAVPGPMAAAG